MSCFESNNRISALAAGLVLAVGCAGKGGGHEPRNSVESPVQAAEPVASLSPGVDLDGPLPPPVKRVSRTGSADPLDLGADRPAIEVKVPRPPAGGAVGFEFGDDHHGWVAHIPEGMQIPTLAYGEKRLYVSAGFESTSFYALDAENGKMVWSSRALEDNGPTAPIYDDGLVVFNTESCTLFVLDAKTGRKLWFKYLGDPTLAQPAVADGLVFASHPADGGYRFTAFKVRTGRQVWSRRIDSELLVGPTVHGDSIYVSSLNGNTYRFLRTNGKRVWRKKLRATTSPWIVDDKLYVTRQVKRQEVQVVVAADTGEIVATHDALSTRSPGDVPHNLNNWKKVWAYEGARPVVIDGVRYVAMGGVVTASDPDTGEAYWTRRYAKGVDKRSLGTVAVAGPQVVISTRGGAIYGLDVDTGYTLWAYDLGHAVVAEPIVAKGWVYAATKDGRVIALQVADSSLDGWHMFGGNPHHNGPTTPVHES